MDPTIYKPSIYNGNGVYKNGAGGGGAGTFPINQKFVKKRILDKFYDCVEISDKVFFPIRNLTFKDENIFFVENVSDINLNNSQAAFWGCDSQYDETYLYSYPAVQYINSIIPSNIRGITQLDVSLIYDYIKKSIKDYTGINGNFGDLAATICAKTYGEFKNALSMLDLGFKTTGAYEAGQFSVIDRYCGFGSSDAGHFAHVQWDNTEWAFYSTSVGWSSRMYAIRFIVDEN